MTSIQVYTNIAYGPHERNVLDAYIPEHPATPKPVLIFMHGGGYVSGDKEQVRNVDLFQECLDAGIAVVSANYRFIATDPFPAPMNDGTRAIQFVRSKAREWGLHPDLIASCGASAGGHILLWNALKGDISQPNSQDEIERYRSDVCAFVGYGTQVSKDQRFYEGIYNGPHIQPNLALFYGVNSTEACFLPETLQLAEEASAINFMSPAAPPAFMIYHYPLDDEHPQIPAEAPVGEVIHHPMHGYVLKQKYDKAGIPFVLRHAADPVQPGEVLQFLREAFQAAKIR